MNYSKTSEFAMAESPFVIRPGTVCDIEITYVIQENITWDSSVEFNQDFTGFVVEESVKSEDDISEAVITVTETDNVYNVKVDPLNAGTICLNIYRYEQKSEVSTAIAAFNSIIQTYYMDYILVDGVVVPCSIIEFTEIEDAYKISVVNVTPRLVNNGIEYINGEELLINSNGLIEFANHRVNILRKGKEKFLLPGDFDGPAVTLRNGQKMVDIDNQEWQDGFTEARGLLLYNSNLLVLTDSGICVFDMYSDCKTAIVVDDRVEGNDLTYYDNDTIGVTKDTYIYKYKLRHDFAMIDYVNKKIYFREKDPRVDVIGS